MKQRANEKFIGTVKAFKVGRNPASKVVTILKKTRDILGEENTERFIQRVDSKGRIILEPISQK